MYRRLWIPLVCLALAGCGDSGPTTYPVHGEVTLDDTPIPEGDIIFTDPENKAAPGAGKISNGQYEAQVTAGKKRVEIRASRMEKLPPGQEGAMGETEMQMEYIPEKYNVNSELTAEVTEGGENNIDFPLLSQ